MTVTTPLSQNPCSVPCCVTPGHGTEVLAGAWCATLQQHWQEMLALFWEALPLAQSSVGGYCTGEQSLINAELQSTLSHPSFPSHRCLCSLIKSLFCSGCGLSAAFLGVKAKAFGVWELLQLPALPILIPRSLWAHHSHLNRGQAERAQICLALGHGELGPVRTCLLTVRQGELLSQHGIFLPLSQHRTPWHELTLQKPQYLHRLHGWDLLRAQLLVLIFSFLK